LTLPLTVIALLFAISQPVVPVLGFSYLLGDEAVQISLEDGRQFTGTVVEETDDSITVQITIKGMKTTRTWEKSEIVEILRNVTISVENDQAKKIITVGDDQPGMPAPDSEIQIAYLIPVHGIIGWDAFAPLITEYWDEAMKAGADVVIFEFDCMEGHYNLEEFRDMIQDFKAEAAEKEVQLAAWVKEARGAAVSYVLMFETIYYHPGGYMGEGQYLDFMLKQMWDDPDVRAKMIAAWVGICRGMAEEGGHDAVLCEALIRPELVLSVEMHGDTPTFYDNLDHEVIESDTELALRLEYDLASRYGVARGVMDSMDDILYDMYIREYYYFEGKAVVGTEKWMERRVAGADDIQNLLAEIEMYDSWNLEPLKLLGRKLNTYKKIERMIKKCPPHGVAPWGWTQPYNELHGVYPLEQVQYQMDLILKQIRDIREAEKNSGPRGGGRKGRGNPGG